jgi:hypothetical protein
MGYEKRRHPAEMSSLRLRQDVERWSDRFTEAEHKAILTMRAAYQRIVEEDETATGRQGMDAWAVLYAHAHAVKLPANS